MAKNVDPDGPLQIPVRAPEWMNRLQQTQYAALHTEKLNGAVTSTRWLPAGLWPEMDRAREDHLKARNRVAEAVKRVNDLEGKFAAEDAGHRAGHEQAVRSGIEPVDHRTPEAERNDQRTDAYAALQASCKVLAEVVEKVRATMAAHEAEWLAGLGDTEEHDAKIRELERELEEAKKQRWRAVQLARWIKAESEGGFFGHQPAPTGDEPMPHTFTPDAHADAFERRYYEQERVRPLTQPAYDDDPLALEDAAERAEAADLGIEPLDPEFRVGGRR